MGTYSYRFKKAGVDGIVALEFAQAQEGQTLIDSWQKKDLITTAKIHTYFDFAFLTFYTLLLIRSSIDQRNVEKNKILHALLCVSIPLAIITGLLDIAENLIMLHNIDQKEAYINSFWLTWPKFIFAAWIIFIFLVSVIKKFLGKLNNTA